MLKLYSETLFSNNEEVSLKKEMFINTPANMLMGNLIMETLMDDIMKLPGEIGKGLKKYMLGIYEAEKHLSALSTDKEIDEYLRDMNKMKVSEITGLVLILGAYAVTLGAVIGGAPVVATFSLAFQFWLLIMTAHAREAEREDLSENLKTASAILDVKLKEAHKKDDELAIKILTNMKVSVEKMADMNNIVYV